MTELVFCFHTGFSCFFGFAYRHIILHLHIIGVAYLSINMAMSRSRWERRQVSNMDFNITSLEYHTVPLERKYWLILSV